LLGFIRISSGFLRIKNDRIIINMEPPRDEQTTFQELKETKDNKPVELTPEQRQQIQRLNNIAKDIPNKNLVDTGKKGSMYRVLQINEEPDIAAKLLISPHNAKSDFETQSEINQQDDEICLAYFGDMVPASKFINVPRNFLPDVANLAPGTGDLYIQLTQNLSTFPTLGEAIKQYGFDHIPQTLRQNIEVFIHQYTLMLDETKLVIEAFDIFNSDTLRVDPEKQTLIITDTNSLIDFGGKRQYVPFQLRSNQGNQFIEELIKVFKLDREKLKTDLEKIGRKCKLPN